MLTIYFKTPTGHRVSVTCEEKDYRATLVKYGRRRWVPEDWPARGYKFPLANHDNFDWALIGAEPGEVLDRDSGEMVPGVWFGGEFYKKRELAANPKKKMAAAIKYSRGFRPGHDDPARQEGDEEGFTYVTPAKFVGDGKTWEFWNKQGDRDV